MILSVAAYPRIIKDFTILSRATEKTEEYIDPTPAAVSSAPLGTELDTPSTGQQDQNNGLPLETPQNLKDQAIEEETRTDLAEGNATESNEVTEPEQALGSRETTNDTADAPAFVSQVVFTKGQRSDSEGSIHETPRLDESGKESDGGSRRKSSTPSVIKENEELGEGDVVPDNEDDIQASQSRRSSVGKTPLSRKPSRLGSVMSINEENEEEEDEPMTARPPTARGRLVKSLHSQHVH